MRSSRMVRSLWPSMLLSTLLAAAGATAPAYAQVSFNINIAPPAPQYEAAPQLAPGYTWAPGYWAWHGDRHVWVRGRTIVQRVGYVWRRTVGSSVTAPTIATRAAGSAIRATATSR